MTGLTSALETLARRPGSRLGLITDQPEEITAALLCRGPWPGKGLSGSAPRGSLAPSAMTRALSSPLQLRDVLEGLARLSCLSVPRTTLLCHSLAGPEADLDQPAWTLTQAAAERAMLGLALALQPPVIIIGPRLLRDPLGLGLVRRDTLGNAWRRIGLIATADAALLPDGFCDQTLSLVERTASGGNERLAS